MNYGGGGEKTQKSVWQSFKRDFLSWSPFHSHIKCLSSITLWRGARGTLYFTGDNIIGLKGPQEMCGKIIKFCLVEHSNVLLTAHLVN